MNLARRFRICWLCLLLPLLSLNGCSTDQSGVTTGKDLEKYRRVYLVRPKQDDHDLTASIFSRLKHAGFDASEINIEEAKKMAASHDAKEPALFCQCNAASTWDYNRTWYCFDNIEIHFYDISTGDLVFSSGLFPPQFRFAREHRTQSPVRENSR
jgi:hypothetical protein